VGARHALFPVTQHWALSLSRAVCFPTLLSRHANFRSHSGIALTLSDESLLSEAFLPGSDTPCREWRAGHGAEATVILSSLLHHCRRDCAGFWPAVGPSLRVWPLTSQAAFASQWGDVVLHAALIEEVGRALPGPFAPRRCVSLAASFSIEKDLVAGSSRRESQLRSGLRSSSRNPLG
jgi:hypothetical protein